MDWTALINSSSPVIFMGKRDGTNKCFGKAMKSSDPFQPLQPKVSSVQGKILPHPSLNCFLQVPCSIKFLVKLKKQSHENIGTPPHLELCWKMEKRLNSTQTIKWLFPQRVAWSHLKPSDFKIVFNDLISHKPPFAWIMIISQQRFGEKWMSDVEKDVGVFFYWRNFWDLTVKCSTVFTVVFLLSERSSGLQ